MVETPGDGDFARFISLIDFIMDGKKGDVAKVIRTETVALKKERSALRKVQEDVSARAEANTLERLGLDRREAGLTSREEAFGKANGYAGDLEEFRVDLSNQREALQVKHQAFLTQLADNNAEAKQADAAGTKAFTEEQAAKCAAAEGDLNRLEAKVTIAQQSLLDAEASLSDLRRLTA